jgi:glycosyltransferase involved in cell wall biosynthesis
LRKLVIISHTDHQLDGEGRVVGWGPTVNEINHLARHFDAIEHVACLEKVPPKGGSLPYSDDRIRLKPIPTFGGVTLGAKLSVLTTAPRVLRAVREALKNATHVQLRLPMGIGLYLLPYFMLRKRDRYVFWVKYANDWGQRRPPMGYALQRWMLRNDLARCKVTINGFWEGQPPHCLSFENPCLNESENVLGMRVIEDKRYVKPFQFAFVGRLEDAKGVSRIIDALRRIEPGSIGEVHFLGNGSGIESYRDAAAFLGEKAVFHGFCNTARVKETLKSSHFFLLPTTASEGFPKAVAEAACYGSIPIVSDVGSIPHYVKDGVSGFVWDRNGSPFEETLTRAVGTPEDELKRIALEGAAFSSKFTFERYAKRINTEISRD